MGSIPLLVLGLGHTRYFKNGSGPCLHGTQHEVGTTRHNFLCDGLFFANEDLWIVNGFLVNPLSF